MKVTMHYIIHIIYFIFLLDDVLKSLITNPEVMGANPEIPVQDKYKVLEERIRTSNNPYKEKQNILQQNSRTREYLQNINKEPPLNLISINSSYAGQNPHIVDETDLPRYLSKYKGIMTKRISK